MISHFYVSYFKSSYFKSSYSKSCPGNHRVQVFNPEGRFMKEIGRGKGEELGHFMQPRSVTIDTKTGCIIVVDTALHRVQVRGTL